MRINHNISALNTYRQLSINNTSLQKSLEKLSSGYRINRAADDAAGLAISEKMRGQIRGLNQAVRNAQDGISLLQTAEGALNEVHSILQRMRELAVQAANKTNTAQDRYQIQKEINQLAEELTRIGDTTEFNTMKLLDGTYSGQFHIGANEGQIMNVSIGDMRAEALKVVAEQAAWVADAGTTNFDATSTSNSGINNLKSGAYKVEVTETTNADGTTTYNISLQTEDGTQIGTGNYDSTAGTASITVSDTDYLVDSSETSITLNFSDTPNAGTIQLYVLQAGEGISVMTETDAETAMTAIQSAIDRVSSERSKLGAYQNRLEHTINNLGTAAENLTAAESRIRDVDMAKEMMEFTKQSILQQAATAMLAQANQLPQAVLQLLR